MIDCQNLTIRYGQDYGIKGLSFHQEKGTTCAIVGRSGCGKTTFIEAVAGLKPVDEGEIKVFDEPMHSIRDKTAIVLQTDGLFPWKTVMGNVSITLLLQGIKKDEVHNRTLQVLKDLDIYEHRDKYINQLSVGQRKRVAIARALLQRPDLLLMDEPTASLDMITKEAVQDKILNMYRKHPMTLITVTHDIEEAAYLGEKILVMKNGSVIEGLDNPTFLVKGIRKELAFYDFCLKIRKALAL